MLRRQILIDTPTAQALRQLLSDERPVRLTVAGRTRCRTGRPRHNRLRAERRVGRSNSIYHPLQPRIGPFRAGGRVSCRRGWF